MPPVTLGARALADVCDVDRPVTFLAERGAHAAAAALESILDASAVPQRAFEIARVVAVALPPRRPSMPSNGGSCKEALA